MNRREPYPVPYPVPQPPQTPAGETTEQKPAPAQAGAASITCPRCGQPVSANFAYCPHCGERLAGNCRYCGQTMAPGQAYCPNCGGPRR